MAKLYSGYPVNFYNLDIVVRVDENNKPTYKFNKKFVDITPTPVSIKTFDDVNGWYNDPMSFYFQQYKFALYCATALCGVSKDQLTQGLPLTRAIMKFHVMYQVKRILAQMKAREPGDNDFNPYNNPYNKNEYQKLLNEFDVRPIDIPEIDQPAKGLGYVVSNGSKLSDMKITYNVIEAPVYPSTGLKNLYLNVQRKGGDWGRYYQFPPFNASVGTKMDSVTQTKFDYNRIIPDHSKGFTNPGLVRVNDSIRAYVYCLLGAQVQARQAGSSLEAQQEFLVLVDDLINDGQTLQQSISNFEDALSKTRGEINYTVAKGLYMIPANMNLNEIGKSVKGFNDQLKIAKDFDGIGRKPDPPKPLAPTAKSIQHAQNHDAQTPAKNHVTQTPAQHTQKSMQLTQNHEGTKILVGLAAATIAYIVATNFI